ncbi:MAG: alpha/beta hydrolase [Parvularculaceae bacterium]
MTPHFDAFSGPHGRIAYQRRLGADDGKPGIVWLGGFRSDMTGTKASFLDAWAEANNRTFLRFDYSGHGASEGAFEDGSIGVWKDDALAVFDGLTSGPQILVGSSMGAGSPRSSPSPDLTVSLHWS